MEVSSRNGVREAELDMARQSARMNLGVVRRIFTSILLYQSRYTLQKPRRAIDREAQRYAPLCE
jgi:hypothetical protein